MPTPDRSTTPGTPDAAGRVLTVSMLRQLTSPKRMGPHHADTPIVVRLQRPDGGRILAAVTAGLSIEDQADGAGPRAVLDLAGALPMGDDHP